MAKRRGKKGRFKRRRKAAPAKPGFFSRNLPVILTTGAIGAAGVGIALASNSFFRGINPLSGVKNPLAGLTKKGVTETLTNEILSTPGEIIKGFVAGVTGFGEKNRGVLPEGSFAKRLKGVNLNQPDRRRALISARAEAAGGLAGLAQSRNLAERRANLARARAKLKARGQQGTIGTFFGSIF